MSISNLYPTIAPSLNLSFALTKALDPRISFVRTTTATYYGTETAKAEENLLLQSQDFLTTWSPLRSVRTANADTAPDGTVTADSIVQQAGQTTAGTISQSTNVIAADYVISVFAKPNGRNFLVILESLLDGTNNLTFFDVQNGTVGTTDAGHTATITASTNSYYRCSIKFTANAARSGSINLYIADTDGSLTVADDGNGLYLWGAQLEQRSAVSSYTPTTTQAITNYIPVLQTAASGVARFDHNPTTGESLGLLVEEQRTNRLVQSEDFNTTWVKARVSITTNTIVSPDGTLTGDKMFENTDNNTHLIAGSTSFTTASASLTISVYAKKAERSIIRLQGGGAANWGTPPSAYFNLDTGVISQTDAATTASITPVGNGWYRCVITGTTAASGVTNPGVNIYLVSTGTTISYTGDGYSGVYLWGAQIEAGTFPTSYIATTSASVTRNADAASMTGTNFSSWFRADEGTFQVAFMTPITIASATFPTVLVANDGTNNNRIGLSSNGFFNCRYSVIRNGTIEADSNAGSFVTANNLATWNMAYKVNDIASSANGNAVVTDTSALIPVVDQLGIGSRPGGLTCTGYIKKVSYYPSRLPDAQLQALTS